jgi:hypothetical protein
MIKISCSYLTSFTLPKPKRTRALYSFSEPGTSLRRRPRQPVSNWLPAPAAPGYVWPWPAEDCHGLLIQSSFCFLPGQVFVTVTTACSFSLIVVAGPGSLLNMRLSSKHRRCYVAFLLHAFSELVSEAPPRVLMNSFRLCE